jgi:hypothetical protein
MNKRIEELLAAATIDGVPQLDIADSIDYEKFAELIVNECAKVADDNFDSGFCPVGGFIREHFGVE